MKETNVKKQDKSQYKLLKFRSIKFGVTTLLIIILLCI